MRVQQNDCKLRLLLLWAAVPTRVLSEFPSD